MDDGSSVRQAMRSDKADEPADSDTVAVTRNLKVKGNPMSIKVGTKVRNIRLVEGVDGHDIDCKVDGFGSMQLKSSVVRKARSESESPPIVCQLWVRAWRG